jgi:bacillopeptidase F (M6 metalloprotease family)
VTSNAHHTVLVQTGPGQTNMTLWHTVDNGNVAAHEFGHMLGNPDEYTTAVCLARNPVNTGTVMDNNSNNVPQRLMQRLADNVGSNVV